MDETRSLFHRLRIVADQVHEQGNMTAGRRGILISLDRHGPQTVPQMARARPVSPQLIQTLVDDLLEDGLIESVHNPAHKRSRLMRLTPKGKEALDLMRQREERLLGNLSLDIPTADLQLAVTVLKAVRLLFESQRWSQLLCDEQPEVEVLAGERDSDNQ
ncbi:MAG TPA: MarR family transcriptional regulator [Symbiobacteriaceae bacterium]|jgi:DNA-binding MarR family transcriptional regulator